MEAVYHAGEGGIEISRPSRFLSLLLKVDMDPSPVYGPYALVAETIGPGQIHVFSAADAVSSHGEEKAVSWRPSMPLWFMLNSMPFLTPAVR